MHARHFTFHASPEHRKAIEALADGIYAFTRTLPGFVSATYFVSLDETEYGSLTLWTSQQAAEAAGAAIRDAIGDKISGVASAPPVTTVLEVYEPAGS